MGEGVRWKRRKRGVSLYSKNWWGWMGGGEGREREEGERLEKTDGERGRNEPVDEV